MPLVLRFEFRYSRDAQPQLDPEAISQSSFKCKAYPISSAQTEGLAQVIGSLSHSLISARLFSRSIANSKFMQLPDCQVAVCVLCGLPSFSSKLRFFPKLSSKGCLEARMLLLIIAWLAAGEGEQLVDIIW